MLLILVINWWTQKQLFCLKRILGKAGKEIKGAEYQSIVLLGAGWRERRDEYMNKIL